MGTEVKIQMAFSIFVEIQSYFVNVSFFLVTARKYETCTS
jgi:hypothetical protein